MANNSIGGFFVSLGIKQDASFKAGEDALKKFIGTATKVAALASVKLAGSLENTNLKLAKSIGISVQDLKAWQDAASKAGVSGSALTSSMANLETKMQKLKLGEIDQGLAKNLGMLGIGYDQFAGMNANDRMNSVFKAAGAMQDQAKAAVLVGDILGSAGREYYDWLSLSGSTLSKELSEAKALNFTTEESAKGAAAFNAEFNAIVSSTKSIALLISSKIGEALTPVAKKVKEILAANKEFIASGIIGVVDVLGKIGRGMGDVLMNLTGADSIGEALGKIAEGIKKIAGPVIEKSIELVKDLAAAMRALWVGDWNALGEAIKNFCTNLSMGFANLVGVDTEGKNAEDLYNDALKEGSDLANGNGGLGSVAKAMAGTNAAVTLALSGKDAKYNYKQDLYDKWQAEVPKNLIGIPETGRALSAFSTDFIKAYLIGVQSGAISPYDNRWLDEESLKKVSSIPVNKDAPLDKLTPEAKKLFNEITIGKTAAKRTSAQTGSIRDGIIRPDGTLTHVAPDDWVFAARNLGDLASAFMPPSMANYAGGATEYSIVQEFTFNGTSRDMAGEVMRQAYRGTQSGLMAAMNKSTQRVQLMPGLR